MGGVCHQGCLGGGILLYLAKLVSNRSVGHNSIVGDLVILVVGCLVRRAQALWAHLHEKQPVGCNLQRYLYPGDNDVTTNVTY